MNWCKNIIPLMIYLSEGFINTDDFSVQIIIIKAPPQLYPLQVPFTLNICRSPINGHWVVCTGIWTHHRQNLKWILISVCKPRDFREKWIILMIRFFEKNHGFWRIFRILIAAHRLQSTHLQCFKRKDSHSLTDNFFLY